MAGRESDVAGAKADYAIRQAQKLQNVFGVGNHGLQIVVAFFRLCVLDHFHLVELVHANKAAGVASGGTSLFAEARRKGAVLQGQFACLKHFAGMDVGELYLCRRDEVPCLHGF